MGLWDSIKRRFGYQEPKEQSGRSYSQLHGNRAWDSGGRRPAPSPTAASKPQSGISNQLRNFLLADENLPLNMFLNKERARGLVEIIAVGPNRYQMLRRENGVLLREDLEFGLNKSSGGSFKRTVKDLTRHQVVSDSFHNDFKMNGLKVPSSTIGASLKRLFESTGRSPAPFTTIPRKVIPPSIKAWEIHHAISGEPYIPKPTFVWRAKQERKGFLSELSPFGRRR